MRPEFFLGGGHERRSEGLQASVCACACACACPCVCAHILHVRQGKGGGVRPGQAYAPEAVRERD